MANMDHWDKLKRPPENALRPIQAGRLKGKSDISPQWRYQVMTDEFGPCGIGWKYTIDRLWAEDGDGGVKFAFAQVTVYVKEGDNWSNGIPGIGGSKLVDSESKGLYSNDEGYKMAVTDALSVSLKMLGVAADIYLGLWDGSKYVTGDDSGRGKPSPNDHQGTKDQPEPQGTSNHTSVPKISQQDIAEQIKTQIASWVMIMGSVNAKGEAWFTDAEKTAGKTRFELMKGVTEERLAFVKSIVDDYRAALEERRHSATKDNQELLTGGKE